MAFFKSDLGPIYISEQTAYCFHQGEISTHVYLMFPSKYLHFKASELQVSELFKTWHLGLSQMGHVTAEINTTQPG